MHLSRSAPNTRGKKKHLSARSEVMARKTFKRSNPDYPRLRCGGCGRTIEDWRDGWVVWGAGRRRRDWTRFRPSCTSCLPESNRGVWLGLPAFVALLLGYPGGEGLTPQALVERLEARGMWEDPDA